MKKTTSVDIYLSNSCSVRRVNCKGIVDTSGPMTQMIPHSSMKIDYTKPTYFCCWHCCHEFDGIPIPIPEMYDMKTDTYSVSGIFCSFQCAKGYLHEQNPFDIGRKSLLLKEISLRLYKVNIDQIIAAPSRLVLKKFGGSFDINEFRTCDKQVIIETPPFVNNSMHICNKPSLDSEQKWNVHGIRRQQTAVIESCSERGLYFDFLKKQAEIEKQINTDTETNSNKESEKKTSNNTTSVASDLSSFIED